MSAEPVAAVRGLHLSLERDGVRSEILRGVDLDIAPGEIVGLVGESGSGKSVLALTLLGLLPDSARPHLDGQVHVAGTDMVNGSAAELRALRRSGLGAIFQDPMSSLNPTMRIGRQLDEATHDRAESTRLLEAVGIRDAGERVHAYPHELSGGLRQRVMAAIAVAGRPSLIIADEPTTALDVTVQAQLLALLRELRDEFGCSVLMITHDLGVAAQLADRIVVLYQGRVAEEGPAARVLHAPSHPYTVGLLAARLALDTPRGTVLPTLPSETGPAAERLAGCAYHTRCPLAVAACSGEQPPLLPEGTGGLRACWRSPAEVRALAAELDRAEHEQRIGADAPDDAQGGMDAATPAAATAEPLVPEAVAPLAETAPPSRVPSPATSEVSAAPAASIAAASAGPAVSLRAVERVFRPRGRRSAPVRALDGVDLDIAHGEAVAIVGESGSGKSTLLRIVAGLEHATGGAVAVAPGGAQMVFQDAGSSLTPWLTVGETLRERLAPLRLGRAEAARRVAAALEAIGLPPAVAQARPAELSGGQRQRVVLARATIIPPAVLLCDEPTSALDASLAASVLNLIREMRARLGMTVLFVTHDLAVARLMGDRVVVMRGGRVVESGGADDVIARPREEYTRRLIAAVPSIDDALAPAGGAR